MKFSESLLQSQVQLLKKYIKDLNEYPDDFWVSHVIYFIQKFYGNCKKEFIKKLSEEEITESYKKLFTKRF